ncbi:MAG: acyl-CoA carboxylase subunit epsilon [Actinobacteria bacterium]|nr:acyl-CoA carboxylase subunit epsilon [Actinomycetota bacterium]
MTDPVAVTVRRGPDPTDEEMAAIIAAASSVLSGPAVGVSGQVAPNRWRFSGRWWVKPVPLRRRRPW